MTTTPQPGSLMGRIMNTAAATSAAPAAPATPAVSVVDQGRAFFVYVDGKSQKKTEAEIIALVNTPGGINVPTMMTSDVPQTWKKPADYGIVPTPVVTETVPPPPADAGLPPPPADAATPGNVVMAATTMLPGAPAKDPAAPPVILDLPMTVDSDVEAAKAIALLFGGNLDSLADVAESQDNEGVSPFTTPYVRTKDGSWEVPKSAPPEIVNYMPVGKRPWFGIYLFHRVGATGWKGKGSKGKSVPPVWNFVVPHLNVDPRGKELTERVLHIGNKVQFSTGGSDTRLRFDTIGQLRPNCHVLVWHPRTGFMTLVVDNWQDTHDTLTGLKAIEKFNGKPMQFSIKQNLQVNKKKPANDPSREWLTDQILAEITQAQEVNELFAAFAELSARDPQGLYKATSAFMRGTDFNGYQAADRDKILQEYNTQFGF